MNVENMPLVNHYFSEIKKLSCGVRKYILFTDVANTCMQTVNTILAWNKL